MICIKILLLILLFFAITPSLGFISLPGFLILTTVVFFFFLLVVRNSKRNLLLGEFEPNRAIILLILLLFYALPYYGGLYQNQWSIPVGTMVVFLMILLTTFGFVFKQKTGKLIILLVLLYLLLGFWTILNSPSPTVDVFVILKEAPIKFLAGQNPYKSAYSAVYPGIPSNYFSYLPMAFLYSLPFVAIFGDPRVGVIFAVIASAYLLSKLLGNISKQYLLLFLGVFFLLPRSFYILEHSYLDPIVFMFLLLFLYLLKIGRQMLALLVLSSFFLFKQDVILLVPILFGYLRGKINVNSVKVLVFLVPWIVPVYYFLINPGSFLWNTFLLYLPGLGIWSVSQRSMSLVTVLRSMVFHTDSYWIYIIVVILFLFTYFIIWRSKIGIFAKMAGVMLSFDYLMYHSYFNHYYFVALLLLADIILESYVQKGKKTVTG